MYTTTMLGRTTMRLLLCSALLLMLGTTSWAQRWELLIRGQNNGSNETGWYGVRPVSTGGYVAVGSTDHVPGAPSWTCINANTDVLVVTITNAGAIGWMQRFDVGSQCQNDVGLCIIECAFGGPGGAGGNVGDFVICGTTGATGTGAGCLAGSTGSFIMRISAAGVLVWTTIYNANGIAQVVEATLGNGVTTNPGDLIFCGNNRAPGGANGGFAARIIGSGALPAPGTIIWDQQYFTFGGLNDIIESTVGAGAGDVVTVGFGSANATIIRANGNTGAIGPAPQGHARFGSSVKLRSVRELQTAPNAGHLVVTGYSGVYILQTTADPCAAIVADILYDVANMNESGESIREIIPPVTSALTAGNIVVTGSADGRAGTDSDVILLEVIPGAAGPPVTGLTLTPGGTGFHIYDIGGANEWGSSLHPVYSAGVGTMPTDGFVICATSNQGGNGFGTDMYLIKTNAAGNTAACDDGTLGPTTTRPALVPVCVNLPPVQLLAGCAAATRTEGITGLNTLCNTFPNPKERMPHETTAPLDFDLALQPNPVKSGTTLKLECITSAVVTATITVSDVTGRTVATHDEKLDAGASTVELNTAGWSTGTYLITVTIDGRSKTERVVVSDR